jgi:hypothetical protein
MINAATRRHMAMDLNRTDPHRQALAEAVGRAIDEADPIALLRSGARSDEYASELRTILPRITGAASEAEVTAICHEEFSQGFRPGTAGPRGAYEGLASRIWQALQIYRQAV